MRKNILARSAIALGTVLLMTAPASAEGVIITANLAPSTTVSTADFNLASRAGVAALKNRIEAAAADLCLTNAVEPVGIRVARAKCYRAAVSSGYQQIDRMVAAQGASPATATATILTKTGG